MTSPLPNTRPALLELHAEARQRRDRTALASAEYDEVCEEIAAIEVQIARIEVPKPAPAKPAPASPASAKPAPTSPASASPAPASPAPAKTGA